MKVDCHCKLRRRSPAFHSTQLEFTNRLVKSLRSLDTSGMGASSVEQCSILPPSHGMYRPAFVESGGFVAALDIGLVRSILLQ